MVNVKQKKTCVKKLSLENGIWSATVWYSGEGYYLNEYYKDRFCEDVRLDERDPVVIGVGGMDDLSREKVETAFLRAIERRRKKIAREAKKAEYEEWVRSTQAIFWELCAQGSEISQSSPAAEPNIPEILARL